MPFDATPRTSIADKIRAILDKGWCKGRLRDSYGRHCLVGALLEAKGQYDLEKLAGWEYDFRLYNSDADMLALSEVVATVSPHHQRLHGENHWNRIASFNNDNATTYDDIVRVLNEFAARTSTKETVDAI